MSLRSTIQSAFNRIKKQFTGIFQRDVAQTAGRRWTIRTDASEARGAVQAVLTIYTDEKIVGAVKEEVGRVGVDIVRELLEPISRTGRTKDSFQYRVNPRSVEIYSDLPHAQFLISGFQTTNVDALMDWMQHKPEFSDLDADEQKRVAFAIRNHMRQGKPPGEASDLGKLQPEGQRSYNYLEMAAEQLRLRIEDILNDYAI